MVENLWKILGPATLDEFEIRLLEECILQNRTLEYINEHQTKFRRLPVKNIATAWDVLAQAPPKQPLILTVHEMILYWIYVAEANRKLQVAGHIQMVQKKLKKLTKN